MSPPVVPHTRRQFLRNAGLIALAGPALSAALDGCAHMVPTATAGLLRVGWTTEPDSMNPMTAETTEAQEVYQLIYDCLIQYSVELKPEPGLATSWEYSPDGKQVTYKLRENATWHDGQPFTAQDAKFTYDLIASKQLSQYEQWVAALTGTEAPDPYTFIVTFSTPQAFNPGLAIPILPRHIWHGMTADDVQKFTNSNPIGTGPYVFDAWVKGQSVTVSRYEHWWGSKPAAQRISWILFGNEDVMAQNLRTGAVDICPELPPTIWEGIKGAPEVATVEMASFSFHHIGINVSSNPKSGGNPLLRDRTVRRALSYAVDRNKLVSIALDGHGIPGSTILPAGFGEWHLDIPPDQQYNANPAMARQLLDQAGYQLRNGSSTRTAPDGKPLSFRLIAIESTSVDVAAAQIFRDSCAEVGIELSLTTLDANTLGNIVYNTSAPDWDIFVWGWDSGVDDPDYLLGVPLTSQIGGNNDVYYSNAHYDALYGEQATELNLTKRLALVHEAQQFYYDDAAYIIMWYQSKLQAYRTDTWTGWTPATGGIILNFTRDNYLNAQPV